MNISEFSNSVPDSVKVGLATGSTALTLFGVPVEQWMYVLSAIVSLLFIIEKLPKAYNSLKQMWKGIRSASRQ